MLVGSTRSNGQVLYVGLEPRGVVSMVGDHSNTPVRLQEVVAPANNAIVASFLFALEVVRVWVVDFIRVAIVGFLRGGRERERERSA